MNVSGIIKGGLLAGLVINLGETVLNVFLVAWWNDSIRGRGSKP